MYNSLSELAWWQIIFPTETTVRTVLIIPSDEYDPLSRNAFKLTVGNLTPPSNNPVCVDFFLRSGAYECPYAMTGRYLGVYRTTI